MSGCKVSQSTSCAVTPATWDNDDTVDIVADLPADVAFPAGMTPKSVEFRMCFGAPSTVNRAWRAIKDEFAVRFHFLCFHILCPGRAHVRAVFWQEILEISWKNSVIVLSVISKSVLEGYQRRVCSVFPTARCLAQCPSNCAFFLSSTPPPSPQWPHA